MSVKLWQWALSAAVLWQGLPAIGFTQPAPAYPTLVRAVQTVAPRLRQNAAELAAAAGYAQQARAWPNPSLAVEVENIAGGGVYAGTSQAQTTLALTQPVPLLGQQSAKREAGQSHYVVAQALHAQQRAQFAYDLAMAYAAAEAAQLRLQLLSEDLHRASEDTRVAQVLAQSGRESPVRVLLAQTAQGGVQSLKASAGAQLEASLAQLSLLAGVEQPYTGIDSSLLALVDQGEADAARTAGDSLELQVHKAQRDAAELQILVERKRSLPEFGVLVGLRRLNGDSATAWVAGLSVSVPLFDRNTGNIAAARAQRDAADARLFAARQQADANWRTAITFVNASKDRIQATRGGEAAAEQAHRLARIGYEAGRLSLLELLTARRNLADARIALLDARLAAFEARASLFRLQGRIPFGE